MRIRRQRGASWWSLPVVCLSLVLLHVLLVCWLLRFFRDAEEREMNRLQQYQYQLRRSRRTVPTRQGLLPEKEEKKKMEKRFKDEGGETQKSAMMMLNHNDDLNDDEEDNYKEVMQQRRRDVCGVAAYFNPAGYRRKVEHFRKFRENAKRQGLALVVAELVFGTKGFELRDDDADLVLRFKAELHESALWQKERLMNIVLQRVFFGGNYRDWDWCTKIVWVDVEVIFVNDDWVDVTSELLEEFKVIQPYTHCIRLPRGETTWDIASAEIGKYEGQIDQGIASLAMDALGESNVNQNSGRKGEFGGRISMLNKLPKSAQYGYTGFAWAARRSTLQKIHGFYEGCIIGGADSLMANAFWGHYWKGPSFQRLGGTRRVPEYYTKTFVFPQMDQYEEHYAKYAQKAFHEVFGSVGAPRKKLVIFHLWHGSKEHRNYENRTKILAAARYDPNYHINFGESEGALKWSEAILSSSSQLPEQVRRIFFERMED